MLELTKRSDESELQYIWRIGMAKDSGSLDMTWDEIADILNNELRDEDEYWTSSAYRKKFQQAKSFYDEVFSKFGSTEYSSELEEQKRELERLKIQYHDERNAWNKQNYTDARVEQKLDYLEEQLKEIGKTQFPKTVIPSISSDNDMLIILSDLHIGQTFSSNWGEYNTDIAIKRLAEYFSEIKRIRKIHNCEKAYVSIQGDLISGQIHKALAITNRENVIDQIKIASELITSFCSELSSEFEHVFITNVSGNHSRIDRKDDALHDERLDDLIGWIIENSLGHIDNITFLHRNLDIGIADMNIRGKTYINVHGDFDAYSKSGVSNLCMMLGFIPYAITFGHLHVNSVEECNGVKMIRGGSLAGSGDSYTIEKRLSGKPSQMICICNSKGVECYYPIEFN